MNYIQRLTNTLDNHAETVSVLANLPVAKLDNKLLLIKKQIASAVKYEQPDAIELLNVWQDQVENAKVLKQELNLADNYLLDVDMELNELAAFEMIEKRQDLLKSKLLKEEFSTNRRK
jgi:hypothetical protein